MATIKVKFCPSTVKDQPDGKMKGYTTLQSLFQYLKEIITERRTNVW